MDFSINKDSIKNLSAFELRELEKIIWNENGRRHQNDLRRKNKCPVCYGSGYTGTEQDHYPCRRCKTTGKYVSKV